MNRHSVSKKEKLIFGILSAIAGALSVLALACLVLFYAVPGFGNSLLNGKPDNPVSIQDKVKVDASRMAGKAADLYDKSSYANVGAGSTAGNASNANSVSAGGAADLGAAAASQTAAANQGAGTGNTAGSGIDMSTGPSTSGDGGQINVGSGSTGATGSDTATNPGSGTDSQSGGTTANGASPATGGRIPSACFGGNEHCYVDMGKK